MERSGMRGNIWKKGKFWRDFLPEGSKNRDKTKQA
jgi:hypothetical protein